MSSGSPVVTVSISGYCGPGPRRTCRFLRGTTIGVAGVLVGLGVAVAVAVAVAVEVLVGTRVLVTVAVAVGRAATAVLVGVEVASAPPNPELTSAKTTMIAATTRIPP